MILVLFLCIIIIFVMLLIIFTILSTIKIKVKNFEIDTKKKIKPQYEISISLNLINRFKWISLRLNSKKMRKIYTKMHLERIDIKKLEKDLKFSDIHAIIKIKPKVSNLNLQIKLGLEDVIITSYIIPLICSIFSIVLPHVTEIQNIKNIKYKIEPLYNENAYHMKLDTTIEIKMINVLNSIYKIYKNRKSNIEKNRIKEMATTHS